MPRKVATKKQALSKSVNSKGSAGAYSVVFFGLGVLVVMGVVIGYFFLSQPFAPSILTSSNISNSISSSSITVPDLGIYVPLQNGKGRFEQDSVEGSVTISEPYFSVKTGDSYDAYAAMVVNTGGSGEFVNIAQFRITNGNATYVGAYPLGDRVKVTQISGPVQSKNGNYSLTVDYLDRDANAPMAQAPTILKSVVLTIKDHKFTR